MRLLQCFLCRSRPKLFGVLYSVTLHFSLPAWLFAMQQTSAADFLISLLSFVSHFHMWEFLFLQHSKIYISHKSGCELLAFLPSSWRAELSQSCNMLLSEQNERNERTSRKFFNSSPTIFAGSFSPFSLHIFSILFNNLKIYSFLLSFFSSKFKSRKKKLQMHAAEELRRVEKRYARLERVRLFSQAKKANNLKEEFHARWRRLREEEWEHRNNLHPSVMQNCILENCTHIKIHKTAQW